MTRAQISFNRQIKHEKETEANKEAQSCEYDALTSSCRHSNPGRVLVTGSTLRIRSQRTPVDNHERRLELTIVPNDGPECCTAA